MNFFGILFTKRKQLSESTITHESIHTAQMKEMLWLFFYLWYGVEYLLVRLFHKKMVIVVERALPVFGDAFTVTACDPLPESGVIVKKSFCIIFEIKLLNEIYL